MFSSCTDSKKLESKYVVFIVIISLRDLILNNNSQSCLV